MKYKIDYLIKNWVTRTEILLVSFLKIQILLTLFTTNMRLRKHSNKNINISVPFYWSFVSPPLSIKTIQNLRLTRKLKNGRHLHWPRALYSPHTMLKTVSILLIKWLEHFILRSCFQIYSGKNNTLLVLYACEVNNLISKGVTSPYAIG